MSEIILQALIEKVEQLDKKFENFDASEIKRNSEIVAANLKALQQLEQKIIQLKIPEEIKMQSKITHTHINSGVRFMLVTLISVILMATVFCGYFYQENTQLFSFKKEYREYQQQLKWHESFFLYMQKKNPKDTKKFIENSKTKK